MKKMVDGVLMDMDATEIQQHEAVALEHEAMKSSAVRAQRNALLTETDWRFRSDLSPSQEWIDYCQALRDVPMQPGFPNEVIWPQKPE